MSLKKVYKLFILISLFSFFLFSRPFNIFQNYLGDLDFSFLNLFCVSLLCLRMKKLSFFLYFLLVVTKYSFEAVDGYLACLFFAR